MAYEISELPSAYAPYEIVEITGTDFSPLQIIRERTDMYARYLITDGNAICPITQNFFDNIFFNDEYKELIFYKTIYKYFIDGETYTVEKIDEHLIVDKQFPI